VKLRYEDPKLNGQRDEQRGFTRFGKEHAKDKPAPDLKEFWHVGRESHLANLDSIVTTDLTPLQSCVDKTGGATQFPSITTG